MYYKPKLLKKILKIVQYGIEVMRDHSFEPYKLHINSM